MKTSLKYFDRQRKLTKVSGLKLHNLGGQINIGRLAPTLTNLVTFQVQCSVRLEVLREGRKNIFNAHAPRQQISLATGYIFNSEDLFY